MTELRLVGTRPEPDATNGIFVGGRWVLGASGKTLEARNPATGALVGTMAAGNAQDVDRAVAAARRAAQSGWGTASGLERGRVLAAVAAAIRAAAPDLARLEATDTGKPLAEAEGDIAAAARYFEFYAGAADKIHGQSFTDPEGRLAVVERIAHGVTGHIIPWNYPAQMLGRSVAPALAMGNACVLKPAEDACLVPLRLAEIACDAGLPAGALNVVPGKGAVAGAALSAHPDLDAIAFIGSPEVGALVQIAAARNHIGCTLELGGKSPHILCADADLDTAIAAIVANIVQNAGQTCSAGSRVLCEAALLDEVGARLRIAFGTLIAGAPEAGSDLGPLISLTQKRRVERYCRQAEADGIPLIAEGKIAPDAPAAGHFVAPRAYGPVPPEHILARDEIFGPILSIQTFEGDAEAVKLANDTEYGLVANIWSQDTARAMRIARALKVGQVFINGYGAGGGVELPFGGMKGSGHGRSKGLEALYAMSTTRTLILDLNAPVL